MPTDCSVLMGLDLSPLASYYIKKVQNNAINIKIVHDSEFKTLKLSYIMIP